jgi:hypothetical protein
LKDPELLLRMWLDNYSIIERCKMWTYQTAFQSRKELLNALGKSSFAKHTVLALHSSAALYGCKNTNLKTLELYVLDIEDSKAKLEKVMQLEPQERGYEVLLIKPYYGALLREGKSSNDDCTPSLTSYEENVSSPLLTFLDLYHYPLRGREQAEFLFRRSEELKRIVSKTGGQWLWS